MSDEVKGLVSYIFESRTGNDLMALIVHASNILKEDRPYEELNLHEKASVVTAELVCLHLQKLGFVAGGSHEVH